MREIIEEYYNKRHENSPVGRLRAKMFDMMYQKKPKYKFKNQKFYLADIKDLKALEKATKKVDILFHFAASADLINSNKYPFKCTTSLYEIF